MKGKDVNAVFLGIAWLISLGAVFVLGILSAFAFHLGPGAGDAANEDLTLNQRDLLLTVERYAGAPVDIAALLAYSDQASLPEQLEQALRGILRENDSRIREMGALRLVRGLPSRWVMGSIRFLQEIPAGPARNQVLERFLETWAAEDGRSAIAFATALASGREQQLAIASVLRGWSAVRPAAAWNWVVEREGNSRRTERWLEVILTNLGSTDRETAFSLVEKMSGESLQTRMALVVMEQILRNAQPREAITWLGELPEATRGAAAAFLAGKWAALNPALAAAWLHEAYPFEAAGLETVLREWVYAAPENAVDWVWETFSGEERRDWMDLVAEEWIANDGPTPVAQWLNTRGADESLDGAIESLALATAEVDPATALVWAQSILDPDARSMLEIVIGREWIRLSPEAAGENLPLLLESEAARAALLNPAYEDFEEPMPGREPPGSEDTPDQ